MKEDKPFVFLCSKGWRGGMEDRGGVAYVLKAFAEEFNKNENVKLILKLNPTYINPQMVKIELDKLQLPENRPEIIINCSNLPYKDLPDLYNQADVFVCATRAESFNLPGIEAMACGLPTIQTTYGGQVDYMTEKNGWFIKVKEMKKVEGDLSYEEVNWAVPDVDDLKRIMRECYNNKEKTKEKGKQAFKDAQNWSWHNSAKKAIVFLNDLVNTKS